MQRETVLIATLGGQPQVVTFALDALLAQGVVIDEVIAVHLSDQRYHQSFRRLALEFKQGRYQDSPCRFRGLAIQEEGKPLPDIRHTLDAEAVWQSLHALLGTLKGANAQIHLLLAGGRRLMALLAMSTAMLHFDHADRVWHIYTPRTILNQARDGALMHVEPSAGVRLISMPLTPWGTYFPGLRSLLKVSPAQVLAVRDRWLNQHERELCRQVWQRLTPRQRDTVAAFANGDSRAQAAERLSVTLATVDSHKREVLAQCRVAWGLAEEQRLDYHFIREKFGPFLMAGRTGDRAREGA